MVKSMPAFRRVSMVEDNGAELTWFTPVNVPSRFSGSIVILCWYDDNPTILADAGQRLEPIKRGVFLHNRRSVPPDRQRKGVP